MQDFLFADTMIFDGNEPEGIGSFDPSDVTQRTTVKWLFSALVVVTRTSVDPFCSTVNFDGISKVMGTSSTFSDVLKWITILNLYYEGNKTLHFNNPMVNQLLTYWSHSAHCKLILFHEGKDPKCRSFEVIDFHSYSLSPCDSRKIEDPETIKPSLRCSMIHSLRFSSSSGQQIWRILFTTLPSLFPFDSMLFFWFFYRLIRLMWTP